MPIIVATARGLARGSFFTAARTVAVTRAISGTAVRQVQTATLTQDESVKILNEQRKRRPNSPHLTIYQPQLTWYLSGLNRITGSALSGGLYVFATAYLVSPLMGWHLDSNSMAEAFGSLSSYTQIGLKALVAFPFTFHSWNGVRHLVWDSGRELSLKGVYRTGYIVMGLTAVTTVLLACL